MPSSSNRLRNARRIFAFDFAKSRDLINQDSAFKNQIASLLFKDLYTCFYYVILFWYLFILTILKQPSELAISKDAVKQPLRLRNILFTSLHTIILFYRKTSH